MLKRTLVTAVITIAGLASTGVAPVAAHAEKYTEHCANGAVIVHTNGTSAWAESGDAKYQLVAVSGSFEGAQLDKDGVLQSFSGTFEKTWTSGKKDVAVVCDGGNHFSDPATGEYYEDSFRATLRQVQ